MLATFTEADWPGRTGADRFAMWRQARMMWHERNGWPGSAVEMIRGHIAVRHRLLREGEWTR